MKPLISVEEVIEALRPEAAKLVWQRDGRVNDIAMTFFWYCGRRIRVKVNRIADFVAWLSVTSGRWPWSRCVRRYVRTDTPDHAQTKLCELVLEIAQIAYSQLDQRAEMAALQ